MTETTQVVKQFSRKKELALVPFEVDGELFHASNVAPVGAILDVAAVNSADGLAQVRLVMAFLDQVLASESAARIADRLKSGANPIDVEELTAIAVWLVEEVYATERPTEAPSPSPDGSGSTPQSTTGSASTNGAPA